MPGGLRGVVPPGQQCAFSHTVSGCVLSRSRPMRYTRTTTVRGSTMLPNDRVQSTGREKLNLVQRVQRATDRIPMPQRIVPIIGAVVFLCPVLAPIAVVGRVRTKMASAYVAMLAIWIIYATALYTTDPAGQKSAAVRWSLIALPVAMVFIAHLGPLRRWYVPCRTVAATLVWPVIFVAALLNQLPSMHIDITVGVIAAWLL